MNVAQFANRVTGAIGIDAATANSATSNEYTLFLSWLNEAVEQFLLETKCLKVTASLAVTAEQGDYTMDSSVLAFEDAYYQPASGTALMLEQCDSAEIRRMRLIPTGVSATTQFYAFEGVTLMLYPAPLSSSDTLHIVYTPYPSSSLAATSDSPSTTALGGVPAEHHHVLESYVKWKAAEYANDAASQNGLLFKQMWEQGVLKSKISLSRKAGMRTGRAVVGRGNWRALSSPGIDVGY